MATQKVPVPDDGLRYIEVKRLGWKALADAREVRELAALRKVREMGGDVFKSIQEHSEELKAAGLLSGDDKPKAPADEYDTATLLHAAIVDSGVGQLSRSQIDELPLAVVDVVLPAIYALNGIGQVAETADDRKNDFAPSPDTSTVSAGA